MANNDSCKAFWESYVAPIIPEIISGRKWYRLSIPTLRTFEELGILTVVEEEKDCKNCVIEYDACKFVTDELGHCKQFFYKGKEYFHQEQLTFDGSLPRCDFHED